MTIAILDYESGNLHSVARAIGYVGGDADVTKDPARIASADALVVPGVGAFGACMRALRERGLDRAIAAFAQTGRPLFGICLGMQVLFGASDEDPVPGLGLLAGSVRRLPVSVKVPHMGWNTIEWTTVVDGVAAGHPYVDGLSPDASYYFVHSFAPLPSAEGAIGYTEHGWGFASVVARGNLFATQFHPEKSGDAGLHLYERFVKEVAAA